MPVIAIPKSLRERLGDEGSDGLVEIISAIDERAREDSLRLLEERFERRLAEEIGSVRVELQSLRVELHSVRAELIKWMFIFWVGQITILAGLMIGLFTFVK